MAIKLCMPTAQSVILSAFFYVYCGSTNIATKILSDDFCHRNGISIVSTQMKMYNFMLNFLLIFFPLIVKTVKSLVISSTVARALIPPVQTNKPIWINETRKSRNLLTCGISCTLYFIYIVVSFSQFIG